MSNTNLMDSWRKWLYYPISQLNTFSDLRPKLGPPGTILTIETWSPGTMYYVYMVWTEVSAR